MRQAVSLSPRGLSRHGHGRRRGWGQVVMALLWQPVSLVFADLASLDKPADGEAMQARVESITRQIRSRPEVAALYVQRGEAYFKLHAFDQAIADFSTAIRLDDRQDDAYFGRGMAMGRSGAIDQGITDLDVYLRRHPKSSLAHTKRGVRYLWKGDEASAEKDFVVAISLDPQNAEAHDDLGVICARRAEYDTATAHFTATIASDPSYKKAYHNLAMVYYITGREQQGLSTINEAIRLAPEDRNAVMLKSKILETLGHHDEARRTRNEADFLPDGNWSEQMPVH
jgi:tetratricopeptide (TPR) repeat protein